MAATTKTIPFSGIGDTDALLINGTDSNGTICSIWSTGNLTFSFPTDASVYNYTGEPDSYTGVPGEGYSVFTPVLQSAARSAFAIFSQYANLKFAEIPETSLTHADIRLALAAQLDLSALGRGYNPGAGPKNGDVWLEGPSFHWENPVIGTKAFLDLMHEIGHALGFSHPGPSMDPSHRGWDYTIMSDPAYPGGDSSASNANGFPTTPMLADVAALQYMYGANFNTNAGNTTYQWSPTTAEMFINGVGQGAPHERPIYMTLWDGGGIDTYDFSNYATNVTADLRPGEWSSPSFVRNDQFQQTNQVALLYNGFDFLGNEANTVYAKGSIANAYLYNGDTRSLIENAIGGSGNDTLIGNQGNNVLTGNAGDDTLYYTGGVDIFNGGVKGTTGDTADFSLSNVGVVITPVASTTTTKLPDGTIITFTVGDTSSLADGSGNAYDASLFTEIGLVHLVEMHGIENITGSPFADTITGNLGNNIIKAGDGNDYVFYTGGLDTIDGGKDNDTIDFSKFGSAVSVTLLFGLSPEVFTSDTTSISSGTLRAIADLTGFENVVGTAFSDSITGSSGNNILDGGAGNDLLIYNGGTDVLNGNTGIDTADFSHFSRAVFVDLAGGGFEAKSNGTTDANGGTFSSIADLQSIENLTGTSFNDVLRGDNNANNIDGSAGNDTLDGNFGNDTLIGGAGIDTVSYLSHDAFTVTSGEVNTISLGLNGADGSFIRSEISRSGSSVAESDVLRGIENVTGSNRAETINGNELDNTLAGRGGNDAINGGAGNDTYDFSGPTSVSIGADVLFDASGLSDRVLINSLSDILSATRSGNDLIIGLTNGSFRVVDHYNGHPIENLVTLDGHSVVLSTSLVGGSRSGIIAAGNGGETLEGNGGDDLLFGGNGSDRLIGGLDNDRLTGGNGSDTFVFAPGFGHDVITDFSPADRMEFDNGVFHDFQAVQAATQQVGGDTVITIDDNNSITLQGVELHSLHASDFVLG